MASSKVVQSDFASKILGKHGWTEGAGLGKDEQGMQVPIRVFLRKTEDKTGMGHDPGKEFTDHWWMRAFNDAAKKAGTKTETKCPKERKEKELSEKQKAFYSRFTKGGILDQGVEEVKKDTDSGSSSEEEELALKKSVPTLDDLHKFCGGATGSRAGAAGIKMGGKLSRAAAQEKMFEEKLRSKKNKHENGVDNECDTPGEDKKSRKRKKRKNNDQDSDNNEDESRKSKKKKKNTDEECALNTGNTDTVDNPNTSESGLNKSIKKKKKKDKKSLDDSSDSKNEDFSKEAKKKKKRDNEESSRVDNEDVIDNSQKCENESKKVKKKKKKDKKNDEQVICDEEMVENSQEGENESRKSEKKKKKRKETETTNISEESLNFHKDEDVSRKAKKKKKAEKKHSEESSIMNCGDEEMVDDSPKCEDESKKAKKKKKKKNISEESLIANSAIEDTTEDNPKKGKKKKKKNKEINEESTVTNNIDPDINEDGSSSKETDQSIDRILDLNENSALEKTNSEENNEGNMLNGIKKRTTNSPFQRVKSEEIYVDPRLRDNSFEAKSGAATSWGYRANQDLIVTRGKGFTKEKNKKKRGSYRGGQIDMHGVHSIKFDSDSD